MSLCVFVRLCDFCSSVQFCEKKKGEHERERPLPQPLPRREGAWSPRYPYGQNVCYLLSLIRANISSNALWTLYAEGLLWAQTVRQKPPWTLCALWEKNLPNVWEKTPQRVVCVLYHIVGAFYFSQSNTEEQNTQHFTETLSQPISQNVTANVSWKASVNSVCRRRSVGSKCAPKGSVNSVRSVREKPPQRVSQLFFLSQKNTEEQNSQSFTETLSQPITQNLTPTFSYNVLWYLYAGGVLWVRNVGGKALLNLWVLWEKKLTSKSHRPNLIERVRSISHRRTQKNRTHKLSQRH